MEKETPKKPKALDIKRMERLKELGIDTSSPSLYYVPTKIPGADYILSTKKPPIINTWKPALTTQDLLDLLPSPLEMPDGTKPHPVIHKNEKGWSISYGTIFSKNLASISGNIMDALYNMLCSLAKEGLIGKEAKK